MGPIEIIQATPSNGSLLAEMAAETFYSTYRKLAPHQDGLLKHYADHVLTPTYFLSKISSSPELVHIAWQSGEIVGYIELAREDPPPEVPPNSLMLHRIYCLAKVRGQGLGKKLINKAEAIALAQGAEGIWLGAWELNPQAALFYQKQGYNHVGTVQWTYNSGGYSQVDDDLLFYKNLQPAFR